MPSSLAEASMVGSLEFQLTQFTARVWPLNTASGFSLFEFQMYTLWSKRNENKHWSPRANTRKPRCLDNTPLHGLLNSPAARPACGACSTCRNHCFSPHKYANIWSPRCRCQETIIWLVEWGKIIVLRVRHELEYNSLTKSAKWHEIWKLRRIPFKVLAILAKIIH